MSEDFPSYEELEAKLWMAEYERDKLRKEAHDKHWPLANACRNLLPPAETNIEQVRLVAEELKSAESAVADLMDVNAELEAQVLYWKVRCNELQRRPETYPVHLGG